MPVDPARAKELFLAVMEMSSAERAAYLDGACAGDPVLRRRVEAMLQTHEQSGELLPRPPAEMLARAAAGEMDATSAFGESDSSAGPQSKAADELSYLAPSNKPGNLGRLGHYEVQQVIGKGGFGTVLRAFDEKLHRVVAIKVLSPELSASAIARQRFIREARAAAAVTHEHVVTIHAVEEDHRPPYLVMQLVDGVTLQEKLDRTGTLGLKETLRIGLQMAEGLAAAHKQGLVHRDIKPANVLLENGVERVKITDFGLAKVADDASVTQSGVVAGTPMYMSPEQADGESLDHRSDLFSLGTVLYVMCTGRPPFRATGTMAVLKRVIEDTPRPVREINPEVPEWLEAVIAKLHAKAPADRYQSARELATVLAGHLADVQSNRSPTPAQPAAPGSSGSPAVGHHDGTKSPVRPWVLRAVSILLLVGFAFWPGQWLLRVARNTGQVWVSGEAKDRVELVLRRDGEIVKTMSGQGRYGFGLEPGNYTCEATYDKSRWASQLSFDVRSLVSQAGEAKITDQVSITVRPGDYVQLHVELVPRVAKEVPPEEPGWVQLFNRKDLDGWEKSEHWKVIDHVLTGNLQEGNHYLRSRHGSFANFHLRADVRLQGNSYGALLFRAGETLNSYDLQLSASHAGSLGMHGEPWKWLALKQHDLVTPEGWFEVELIADGSQLISKVNGQVVAKVTDTTCTRGSFSLALNANNGPVVVQFKKIEIKQLPPATPPLAVAPFDAAKAKEHQDAWAKHLGVDVEIKNSIGMKLGLIPPGQFLMGSPPPTPVEKPLREMMIGRNGARDEFQHEVMISRPFYMGAHAVTVGQFRDFVKQRGYKTEAETKGGAFRWRAVGGDLDPQTHWDNPGYDQTNDHPVTCVTWNDARAFCDWLSEKEGKTYTLPTEAQWEYACRAGSQTKFPYGDDDSAMGEHVWYSLNADGQAHPVGRKKSNAWRLYDMTGNVWQWVADHYQDGYYPKSSRKDPTGPDVETPDRIFRGGSWVDGWLPAAQSGGSWLFRSAHRQTTVLDNRCNNLGFRVALVVDAKPKPTDPAAADQKNWIDLMPLVDPKADAVEGKWRMDGKTLVCDGAEIVYNRLALPVRPVGDYELLVEFTRKRGGNGPSLNLPVGSRHVHLAMDCGGGSRQTALELVDGHAVDNPENPTHTKDVHIADDVRYLVEARVSTKGDSATIQVDLDGKRVVNWTGKLERLSTSPDWSLGDNSRLGLHPWGLDIRYESLKLRMLSGEAKLVRPPPASKINPFVVPQKPGRAEQAFPSLADAVKAAQSGDTIEIRGDGPFLSEPINLADKALAIRAGSGFRPVVKLDPAFLDRGATLLSTRGLLILEGLELHTEATKRSSAHLVQAFGDSSGVIVRHCRLVATGPAQQAFALSGVPRVEIRNTEVRGASTPLGWAFPSQGTMVLDQSVVAGSSGLGVVVGKRPLGEVRLVFRNSTVLGLDHTACAFNWRKSASAAGGPKDQPAFQIEASGSILHGKARLLEMDTEARTPEATEELAAFLRAFRWKEGVNLLGPARPFLADYRKPYPADKPALFPDDWKTFWKSESVPGLVGEPRFTGGDVMALKPEARSTLTAAALRLADDSPGKGKGEGGKDLGADVDLVGPGAAHETWKKTKEYDRWRKQNDALLAGAGAPFVLLARDKRAETTHASLADAVKTAQSGDTIEIRGDGPFASDAIDLDQKPLTIRAAAGFRPVIKGDIPGQPGKNLLATKAALVLEGLGLFRDGDDDKGYYGVVASAGPSLRIAHCRIRVPAKPGCPVFVGQEVRDCEIRNSLLQCGGPWQALQAQGPTRLHVENSVLTARGSPLNLDLFSFPDQDRSVTLRHNTLVGRSGLLIQMQGPPPEPLKGRIHVVTAGNLFVGKGTDGKGKDSAFVGLAMFAAPKKAPASSVVRFLREGFVWKGDKDVLALNTASVYLGWNNGVDGSEIVPIKDVPELGRSIADGTVITPDAVGFPECSPADVHPADLRIAPGSPGKGAGPGGRDVGADVDNVGPGAAYDRWRQSKAYEQWRQQTEAR